jgi:hypothetical protein
LSETEGFKNVLPYHLALQDRLGSYLAPQFDVDLSQDIIQKITALPFGVQLATIRTFKMVSI